MYKYFFFLFLFVFFPFSASLAYEKVPMDKADVYLGAGQEISFNSKDDYLHFDVHSKDYYSNFSWASYQPYGENYPEDWKIASFIVDIKLDAGRVIDLSFNLDPRTETSCDNPNVKRIFKYDNGIWKEIDTEVLNIKTAKAQITESGKYILLTKDIMEIGDASWYRYKECMCAASPDYAKGTKLEVTDLDTGKSIVITVNDWGPERDIFPNRVIDLDAVAFEALGWSLGAGVLHNIKVSPFSD